MSRNEKSKYVYNPANKMQGFRKRIGLMEFKQFCNFYEHKTEEEISEVALEFRNRGYSGSFIKLCSTERSQANLHIGEIRTTLGWVEEDNPRVQEWIATGFIRVLD